MYDTNTALVQLYNIIQSTQMSMRRQAASQSLPAAEDLV